MMNQLDSQMPEELLKGFSEALLHQMEAPEDPISMINNKNRVLFSSTSKHLNSAKILTSNQNKWEAIPARSINSLFGERDHSMVSDIYITKQSSDEVLSAAQQVHESDFSNSNMMSLNSQ